MQPIRLLSQCQLLLLKSKRLLSAVFFSSFCFFNLTCSNSLSFKLRHERLRCACCLDHVEMTHKLNRTFPQSLVTLVHIEISKQLDMETHDKVTNKVNNTFLQRLILHNEIGKQLDMNMHECNWLELK